MDKIEQFKDFGSAADLMSKVFEKNKSSEPTSAPVSEPDTEMDFHKSPAMEMFEGMDNEQGSDSRPEGALKTEQNKLNTELELSSPEHQNLDSNLDIEELFVRGSEGRREKLKIDYSDKKAIKEAFIKAAGMRKFQAERDSERKSKLDIQKEYEGLKSDFSKLEKAFTENGVKGVVALLGGGDKAWEDAVESELKHRDYISGLSPAEKYKLEMQEKEKLFESRLASERAQREKFEQQIKEKEETTELRSYESKLHPAFDRYRFSGKLNDPVAEHRLDKAIWTEVLDNLKTYPENVELTQSMIDKEFRAVASSYKKLINTQTEQSVKKTIEKKKEDATQRAGLAAKKGLSGETGQRKVLESLKSGNLTDAISAWMSNR